MVDCDSRRSSRSRKEINYSAFAEDDDSDDADFTDPTPPPAKKPREEKEKGKKTKRKKKSDDLDEDYCEFKEVPIRGKRKERKPLEDRMFDRELELALEMSKQDSSQETTDEECLSKPKKRAREVDAVVHAPAQVSASDEECQENKSPIKKKCSPPRKPAAEVPAKQPRASSGSPKKKTTKSPAVKPATGVGVKRGPLSSKTGAVRKSAPLSKASLSPVPASKSSTLLASPRTVALKRPPAKIPAGSANNPLGGVKLVSPGAPIRLGLSKFARVKPLHGNVKV